MSLLTIRDLTISHNKQNMLNNINLKLNTAEIIGIAGGSGSGKTTLLSLLAGLDEPRKGEVLYNNEDIKIKGYENHRKNNISLIFQNYNLIDYMTPLENLKIDSIRALSEGKHLKLTLKDNNYIINAIGFNIGYLANEYRIGDKIDVAGVLEINTFNGVDNLQINIKDIMKSI